MNFVPAATHHFWRHFDALVLGEVLVERLDAVAANVRRRRLVVVEEQHLVKVDVVNRVVGTGVKPTNHYLHLERRAT